MCGIFGIISKEKARYRISPELLGHRGPDAFGEYNYKDKVYLAHNRLAIIDTQIRANQPMKDKLGRVIVFNGEIYNFKELKSQYCEGYEFQTNSDTELVLALYHRFRKECLNYLKGMFSFAIWDEVEETLFCARDHFGIKPFYYIAKDETFIFASEIKALLPFLDDLNTSKKAFSEYLVFQYTLGKQTLFDGIHQLQPAHCLLLKNQRTTVEQYWNIKYEPRYDYNVSDVKEKLQYYLSQSVKDHLISDSTVKAGAYLSGGVDSSLMAALAAKHYDGKLNVFHGRFNVTGFDESEYAIALADQYNLDLHIVDITANDFIDNIEKVIYHLDTPVGGPGAFPQYMVSKVASEHVKLILAGQGGDEIFGGYARYLLAYFEQSIKAAIEGTYKNGNYIVTPESIIPNLISLKEYKPMIKSFWKEGIFEELDARYFRLIDRSIGVMSEVNHDYVAMDETYNSFRQIFNGHVKDEAYFDKMTHFDLKCLLPALLHVEDRVSMAHGLESRVPFLDKDFVEFIATIGADIKFPGGKLKALLKDFSKGILPNKILNRTDKMGFPVPFSNWMNNKEFKNYLVDIFSGASRELYDCKKITEQLNSVEPYSRKLWGFLSLELWHQQYHDRHTELKKLVLD